MNIYLNTGEFVQIHNQDQFQNLLEDKLGKDCAVYFNNVADNLEEDLSTIKYELDTQQDSVSNLVKRVIDIETELLKLLDYMDNAKRIDRNKIHNKISEIRKLSDVNTIEY